MSGSFLGSFCKVWTKILENSRDSPLFNWDTKTRLIFIRYSLLNSKLYDSPAKREIKNDKSAK